MKKITIIVSIICIFGMYGGTNTTVLAMGDKPDAQDAKQQQEEVQALEAAEEYKRMQKNAKEARKLIIARVNGDEISMYSLVRMMNKIAPKHIKKGAEITPEVTESIKKKALDRLITQELAVQAAGKKGITIDPEKIDKIVDRVKKGLETEEAYQAYLDKFGFTEETFKKQIERGHKLEIITGREIYDKVKVDPKEIEKEYKKFKKEGKLRMADNYIIKDVLLMRGDSDVKTKKRAEELLDEIKKLNYDTGKLVLDGTFITRRLQVTKERYPAIYKKMAKMKVGETSGVVKDKDSYHIFKVIKNEPARDQTLEEAKGFIENRLRVPAQTARTAKFEEELRKDAKIEILLEEVEKELKERAENNKTDSHS